MQVVDLPGEDMIDAHHVVDAADSLDICPGHLPIVVAYVGRLVLRGWLKLSSNGWQISTVA